MQKKFIENLKSKVKMGKDVFIASTATIIGDVILGDEVSVWYGAVIRGDIDRIKIGKRSNIQDNVVIHVDQGSPVIIGNEVTVGHGAIVHGATIGNNTLVGMGSTILNDTKIGKFCIIGANALITTGIEIPDYSIALGSPAKIIGKLNSEQIKKVKKNAKNYIDLSRKYLVM